jgi:hypothetical protein
MFKVFLFLCVLCFFSVMPILAQNPATPPTVTKDAATVSTEPQKSPEQPKSKPTLEETVKGVIKEISADGNYIIIDDKKIMTTKELLEDSYLEVGDKVEVIAEKTDAGLQAKTCNYIFEEENNLTGEESAPGMENLP